SAGWFSSSGWRLCRPECAHGWSPCGILQRSAWASQASKPPPIGGSPGHEPCTRSLSEGRIAKTSYCSRCLMANSTLATLTASGALTGTELFYSDTGSADVKVTANQLKTFIVGAGAVSVAFGKTLTVANTLTLAGTDGSTLNVGAGGTLGTAAFVNT